VLPHFIRISGRYIIKSTNVICIAKHRRSIYPWVSQNPSSGNSNFNSNNNNNYGIEGNGANAIIRGTEVLSTGMSISASLIKHAPIHVTRFYAYIL